MGHLDGPHGRRGGGRGADRRRDLGRLARGLRTPEAAFHAPVLQSLVDLGGSAPMAEVLEKVRQQMEGILKDVDYQPLASDPELPRWRNTAQWCRAGLVKEGLIKGDSRRGILGNQRCRPPPSR